MNLPRTPLAARAATLVALSLAAASAEAGVFTLIPSSADTIIGKAFDEGVNPLGYRPSDFDFDPRVGTVGGEFSNRVDQQKVYGFTLPVLDHPAIKVAFLMTDVSVIPNSVPFNLDLYFLNTTNPDGSGTSLFFEGPDDFAHQKLKDDFIKGDNSTLPPIMIDLKSLLQSHYTGTTPNQSEIFFRVNPDANVPLISAGTGQYIPLLPDTMILLIDTVPEPATFVLLTIALCSMFTFLPFTPPTKRKN